MVEIIKRGDWPGNQEYEVDCRKCKSELRFRRSEAKEVVDPRDGDFLQIRCPVCSAPVTKAL